MNHEKMIDKHVRKSQSAREGQLANWLSRVLSNWHLLSYVCLTAVSGTQFCRLRDEFMSVSKLTGHANIDAKPQTL